MMRVTVCEIPNHWATSNCEQDKLKRYLELEGTDLLLLPEMPFSPWLAGNSTPNCDRWKKAVDQHQAWIEQLDGFNAAMVAGTRPVIKNHRPQNQGFIWTRDQGTIGVHEKYYLPDEPGFYESTWYDPGDGTFEVATVCGIRFGFLICTELWFNHWARAYGKAGMDILLCPRAGQASSNDAWIVGGRAAAYVSGAYCLSANFNGPNTADIAFGGTGWIMEPETGNIMGTTSKKAPFLTLDIDLNRAGRAKSTYPRCIKD